MLRSRRSAVLVAAFVGVAAALPVLALGGSTNLPVAVSAPAERLSGDEEVVTVFNSGALTADVMQRALQAVTAAGGTGEIGRSASTGMQRVRRGGAIVQQAPFGAVFPMATTMLPKRAVFALMGASVAASLSATSLVMGERTAGLRGAQAGDVVDLVASNGTVIAFTIGAVVSDDVTGGTELLMSIEGADRLGVTRPSRVVLWDFDSRADIDRELAANSLVSTEIRIRRSWDESDPDRTLGMAETKEALGEFWYKVSSSGSGVSISLDWYGANIDRSGPIGKLNLQSGCHRVVRVALANAMAEVIAVGLENTINYRDANSAGGCWTARFSRQSPNSSIGFLSRHTWGMAVDTNTVGSCLGCAPPDLDCQVVRIFRKHGFAWGGNFLTPDGMHFEWVGEPRHQGLYPSRYCPNVESATNAALDGDTQRSTLFVDDGLRSGDSDEH
ncbi:MAG: M15 family metallopeptidase [Actinomycetota bacterium]|nr:M15 family metallopeptidase [Actinomycetota bacterium]